MTAREMQIEFDMYIQQADPRFEIEMKPDSYTVFRFINRAQEELVKTRYTGNNKGGTGFEQSQKRTDDLRTLVKDATIVTAAGTGKPNSFVATLPTDYFITVGEEVDIDVNSTVSRVSVKECTTDFYSKAIDNPYSEHILHYNKANPLRLFIDTEVELITDGQYTVPTYYLRYLKLPSEIKLGGSDDCELPEHMHSEIVADAVNLFFAFVKDEAYQTSKIELQETE